MKIEKFKQGLIPTFLSAGLISLFATNALAKDNNLGEIVISSTKTELAIEKAPNTIELINAEEIKEMGASTVSDVLGKIAGLEQTNQKGSFNIRGMGFGYSIIMINGRKPAVLESRHDGLGFLLGSIGVSNIERIEVIRGQAGAMYGANALSGVVNIITKKSTEPGGSISIGGGSDEFTQAFQYDFGRIGNWDAIINVSNKKGRGVREESVSDSKAWRETDSGTTKNLNLDMGYHFNENHELRFLAGYINQNRHSLSKSLPRGGGSTYSVSRRETQRKNYSNTLQYNGEVGTHSYSVTANRTKSLQNSDYINYSFKDYGIDAMDTWAINDTNLLTYGAEYLKQSVNHPLVTGTDKIDRKSLFLQNEISLLEDTLLIVPSVRYDNDSAFGGEVIPRLAATWEFMEDQRLKVNVGKAYNAPNLIELYGVEQRGHGYNYGNEDLKPETSLGWEVRYEGTHNNIRTSLGYFEADIEDKISSERIWEDPLDPNNYNSQAVNIDGTTKNKGVEASVSVDFLENFTLTGDYTWLDNKNSDGDRIGYYAEQTVGLDLGYSVPEWGFSSNIWGKYNKDYTNYTGGLDRDGNNALYNYYNVNLSMNKTFKDKYTLSFAAYDLFSTSRTALNDGSVSPLKWRITFEAKF